MMGGALLGLLLLLLMSGSTPGASGPVAQGVPLQVFSSFSTGGFGASRSSGQVYATSPLFFVSFLIALPCACVSKCRQGIHPSQVRSSWYFCPTWDIMPDLAPPRGSTSNLTSGPNGVFSVSGLGMCGCQCPDLGVSERLMC